MAYPKTEVHYEHLSTNTKLRFIEVEMSFALPILSDLLNPTKTSGALTLAHYLAQDRNGLKEDLVQVFNDSRFRNPTRDEIIHYFRYRNIGVSKVVKYANTSPNTVLGYKDKYPNFVPVFKGWDTFPDIVIKWDQLKSKLNLFNDILVHSKHSHAQYLSIEQIEIPIFKSEQEEPELEPKNKYAPLLSMRDITPFNPETDNIDEWIVAAAIKTTGRLPGDYIKRIESGEFDHIMPDLEKYLDPRHQEEYDTRAQPE